MGSRNEWGRTNVTKYKIWYVNDEWCKGWEYLGNYDCTDDDDVNDDIGDDEKMTMMMMWDDDDDDARWWWCQRRSADRSPPGAWRTKLPHNLQTIIIVVVVIVVVVVVVDAVVVVIIILISKVLRSQILNSWVVESSSYTLLEFLEFSDPGIPRHFFFVTSKVCLW